MMTVNRLLALSFNGVARLLVLSCSCVAVAAEPSLVNSGSDAAAADSVQSPAPVVCGTQPANGTLRANFLDRTGGWHTRLAPPGDLSPRYPYSTWRTYYYDRPYNADHVASVGRELSPSSAHPYGQQPIDEVMRAVEREVYERHRRSLSLPADDLASEEDEFRSVRNDGYLEFTDWRKHREQRLKWEMESTERLPPAR